MKLDKEALSLALSTAAWSFLGTSVGRLLGYVVQGSLDYPIQELWITIAHVLGLPLFLGFCVYFIVAWRK